MTNRLTRIPGTPARVRVPAPGGPERKVDIPRRALDDVVPIEIRIEVAGGRSSTASAMRADRVRAALEEVGATARTVEIEGEHAALPGEADRRQVLHVARMPFVRRVMLS